MAFTFEVDERFFNSNSIVHLLTDYVKAFQIEALSAYGGNIRKIQPKHLGTFPAIQSAQRIIADQIEKKFQQYSVQFESVWAVNSQNQNADMSVLPYVPHFDKLRAFKAMVYLDDVTLADGPIHLAPPLSEDIETRRLALPANHKQKQLNRYAPVGPEDTPKPITAPAGSIIYFDTNTPHHAGFVEPGGERNVLRFDFKDSRWNTVFA